MFHRNKATYRELVQNSFKLGESVLVFVTDDDPAGIAVNEVEQGQQRLLEAVGGIQVREIDHAEIGNAHYFGDKSGGFGAFAEFFWERDAYQSVGTGKLQVKKICLI